MSKVTKRTQGNEAPPQIKRGIGAENTELEAGKSNPSAPIQSRRDRRKQKRPATNDEPDVKEKTQEEIEREEQDRYERAQAIVGKEPPHFVHLRRSNASRLNLGNDIKVEDYTLQVPGRTLLESASFTLAYGHRYGLVGRNGNGKSTLLKRIAERDGIAISGHLSVLYVDQEVPGDDTAPIDYVMKADVEREWLLDEERTLIQLSEEEPFWMDNPDEKRTYSLKDVQERLFDIQSAKALPRAAAILAGLGFDPADIHAKPTREYSGGWRMRIALARALFCRPDVLLLDEPTNHLDLHACFWLEQYLAKWKSTLLVVSHEATFLNEIVDRIIEIRGKQLTTYKGNYWTYLQTREIDEKTKQKHNKKVASERDHILSRGGNPDKIKSTMAQIVRDDPSLRVSFPDPDPVPSPICQFQEVSFGYDANTPMFTDLEFSIDMESRIALVGMNGVGKSTLMKLMSGELQETSGYIFRNRKARTAKFSQHSLEQLDASQTPMEYLEGKFQIGSESTTLRHLGRFGISGPTAGHKIETLSGGQKSRVVLAELAWAEPHVLFLDEPSNHLDLDAIEGLAQGLNAFKGGIVMISHNQRLISLVCSEIWVVTHEGKLEKFHGNFEDYKEEILNEMEKDESEEEEGEEEKEEIRGREKVGGVKKGRRKKQVE